MKTKPIFVPYRDYGFSTGPCPNTTVVYWPDGVPFPVELTPSSDGSCLEARFEIETRGPWQITTKVVGLAVSMSDEGITIYGKRRLLNPTQSGYAMEGRVSIEGKKHRAFTSSQLFEVEGRLVDVALLYVCGREPK